MLYIQMGPSHYASKLLLFDNRIIMRYPDDELQITVYPIRQVRVYIFRYVPVAHRRSKDVSVCEPSMFIPGTNESARTRQLAEMVNYLLLHATIVIHSRKGTS